MILRLEPIICPVFGNPPGLSLKPAYPVRFPPVEVRYIGFDIKQGSAVSDIDVLYMQNTILCPEQSHYGETDGVGPRRCPNSKYAMDFFFHKGPGLQGISAG